MKHDDDYWDRIWEPDTAYDEYEWSKKHGWIKEKAGTLKNTEPKGTNLSSGKLIACVCLLILAFVFACISGTLCLIFLIAFGIMAWSCLKK